MKHPRRIAAGAALALAAIGVLTPAGTAPPVAQAAAPPTNFVANSTFDPSCDGWYNNGYGNLTLVSGGRTGYACRLDQSGGRTAVLNDYPNTVVSTQANTTYRATGWVKAGKAGVQVQARMMEYTYTNQLQGQASEVLTLPDTTWRPITVTYKAVGTGNAIDFNLLALSLPADTYLDIDDVTLTPETNQVANPDFESGIGSWIASYGSISQVSDGRNGTKAVRVTADSSGRANLNDQPNTVASTTAGTTYIATAWVKASSPGVAVTIRQMEWGTSKVGESVVTYTLPDTGWWPVQSVYTALSNGASIDLNLYSTNATNGYFVVDDVALSTYSDMVLNSQFDGGTWGWRNSGTGTLEPLAAGRTNAGARLTAVGTSNLNLNDIINSVQNTVQGTTYTATAWAKASTSQSARIRLMEYDRAGANKGSRETTFTLGTSWTQMTVSYTAATSDATLDLNIYTLGSANGFMLDVDDISLVIGTTPPVDPYTGWHKTFEDDFNGSSVDTAKWNVLDNNTYGAGGGEMTCQSASNARVANGILKIVGEKLPSTILCEKYKDLPRDYTTAHLTTEGGRYSFQYGRAEMRAKTPLLLGQSKGLWPAFWMKPTGNDLNGNPAPNGQQGEIDILEQYGTAAGTTAAQDKAKELVQTLHWVIPKTPPEPNIHYQKNCNPRPTLPNNASSADGFHVYGIEWNANSISWYVDDPTNVVCTIGTSGQNAISWYGDVFRKPYYLRVNLAIGGNNAEVGAPDAATAFPANYEIDWIRVWQKN